MPTGGPGLFLGKCHFSDFWWSCYSRKCTFPGFREIPEKHDHPGPWVFWWAVRGQKVTPFGKNGEKRQFLFGGLKKRCHFRVFANFRALFGNPGKTSFFDHFSTFSRISPKNDFSRVFWSPAPFFDPPTQNPSKSALFPQSGHTPQNPGMTPKTLKNGQKPLEMVISGSKMTFSGPRSTQKPRNQARYAIFRPQIVCFIRI